MMKPISGNGGGFFIFEKSLMKKAISSFLIIGAVLLIETPAFGEVISIPVPQFPDPSLFGRPPVPGMPPNVGQPIVPDIQCIEPDYVSFVKKLEAIPENKIDVGLVALKLAKDIHPKLNIKAYSAKIDKLAARAKTLANGSALPNIKVGCINTVLFKEEGLRYNFSDPLGENIDTELISGVLDSQKGSCYSLPLVYLAVAQRLGYPIYPVIAPQHVFLRYVDPSYTMQNIEPTFKGFYTSDETYIETFHITPKQIKTGAYLRTLTYKEYLGEMIACNGEYWYNNGDYDRGLYYTAAARRLFPKSADICKMFGYYLISQSKYALAGQDAIETRKSGEWCLKKAEEMGVTHLTGEDYLKDLAKYSGEHEELRQYLDKRKSKGAKK